MGLVLSFTQAQLQNDRYKLLIAFSNFSGVVLTQIFDTFSE